MQTLPIDSIASPCNNQLIIIDNKQSFPRLTSNDSGISFDESDNESLFSDICEYDIDQYCLQPFITLNNDAHLASLISDDEKNFFCENPAWIWHGEFGRLIMATAMKYNIDYRLMLSDAYSVCPLAFNAHYSIIKLDNAKAQFKCHQCGHCWTSMRARCSFHISEPTSDGGIILLKLYAQQCQYCYSTVDPIWYYDEICRVMKNLAFTIFEHYFPHLFHSIYWDLTHNGRKPIRRLLQRKGYMRGQHNPSLCEACQLGFCY